MLGFVIESDRARGAGTQGFIRRMREFESRAGDMSPAFREIHKQFLAAERGIFASQGGGKWQPLTPAYAARKARHGQDPRIERATGALAQALTSGAGPGAVKEITRNSATFGTNLPEAVYAHRGSGKRRRRLITIDRRRRNRWTATLRAHLLRLDRT